MLRILALTAFIFVAVIQSEIIKKNSDVSGQESSDSALAIVQQHPDDIAQEGQFSDLIVRAKRYYGCGCGCGCATVAAVSAAPCYGCCGCG